MMMTLNLNALQLSVSLLGLKYLHNNGVNEMAGLKANASVMVRMVRKRCCGDPGL